MTPTLRASYNQEFTPARYQAVAEALGSLAGEVPTFRLCETPIFLPDALATELLNSANAISAVIADPAHLAATASALRPPYWSVPGELGKPLFLQYDFAICREGDRLVPWLIELQGFPSLYAFQADLATAYRDGCRQNPPCAWLDAGLGTYFNGLSEHDYFDLLQEVILNGHEPESVILLEIDPWHQNTRIDFSSTQRHLGIPVVGLEDLILDGRKLYYERDRQRQLVKRIYNRVILDELLAQSAGTNYAYTFREEVDVEWAAHPDWFLRISKHTLPALAHLGNVPDTIFLDQYKAGSLELEHYVLKPLYSFSGAGVNIHPTEADVAAIDRPANWILQKKVAYGPVLQTPTGDAKVEVRMMLVWRPGAPQPEVVNNLIRVTKGEMTGVKYNKDKDWVGASVGFHALG